MKNRGVFDGLRQSVFSLMSVASLIVLPGAAAARRSGLAAIASTGTGREALSRQDPLPRPNEARPDLQASVLLWQLIGPTGGESVLDIDVDPYDSQRLYAATQSGIYRSTDGGAEWELVLSGFFRELVIDPQNSSNIYTGQRGPSGYGVYKSTDGGDTWHHYNEGMTCDNLATLSIAASSPNILFIGSY